MGTAQIVLQIEVTSRAQWDTIKTEIQAFVASHPIVKNVNLQYSEIG